MIGPSSGVSRYITGTYTVKVHFPVDLRGNVDINCRQCKYFFHNSRTCCLNGEVCEYPEHYRGSCCPLNFEIEEDDNGSL